MLGIYVCCFIVFPLLLIIPIRRNENVTSGKILNIADSNMIKGMAICFVMLSHLVSSLESVHNITVLRAYTVLGGMGVLLFFFLSGYGLYNGYAHKEPDKVFVKKRIKNVVYPYVVMKLFFYLVEVGLDKDRFAIQYFVSNFLDWFIVVILLEYCIFFVAWALCKRSEQKLILYSFIANIVVFIFFVQLGLTERWYNGLMLFPVGMLIARNEDSIAEFFRRKWLIKLIINLVLFSILGVVFVIYKGQLWADIVKGIAGISLSIFLCGVFVRYKLESPIMRYVGRDSLYYYIIHLNVMLILEKIGLTSVVWNFYLTILITILLVWVFKYFVSCSLKITQLKR